MYITLILLSTHIISNDLGEITMVYASALYTIMHIKEFILVSCEPYFSARITQLPQTETVCSCLYMKKVMVGPDKPGIPGQQLFQAS